MEFHYAVKATVSPEPGLVAHCAEVARQMLEAIQDADPVVIKLPNGIEYTVETFYVEVKD